MCLELRNKLRHSLSTIVNLILLSKFSLRVAIILTQNSQTYRLQSAENHKHNVVCIVLFNHLMLMLGCFLGLILRPHKKQTKYILQRDKKYKKNILFCHGRSKYCVFVKILLNLTLVQLFFYLFIQCFIKILFLNGSIFCILSISIIDMSCSAKGASTNSQTSKQEQKNSQKLIQDQNYSNQIFYGLLSTIESIILYHHNRSHQYNNKMFKNYDRVNYSSKNIHQLRSQLQSHLFIFLTSLKVFQFENQNNKWILPQNFNQHKSLQFLMGAVKQLEGRDQCSQSLVKDVINILHGQLNNHYFENVNLSVLYSEQEKRKHKNDVFHQGMFSNNQMEERQKEVQNAQSVNQLNANINTSNTSFFVSNNPHYQKNHNYQNQDSNRCLPHSKDTNIGCFKGKNQSGPMDIETSQSYLKEGYYIFKNKQDAKKFLKKKEEIDNLRQGINYYYIQNTQQLKQKKNNLCNNQFVIVVAFPLDNHPQNTKHHVQVLYNMKL